MMIQSELKSDRLLKLANVYYTLHGTNDPDLTHETKKLVLVAMNEILGQRLPVLGLKKGGKNV